MIVFIGPTHGVTTGQSTSLINLINNYKKKYISLNTNFEGKNIILKFKLLYQLYIQANKISRRPKTVYLSIKRSFFGLLSDYIILKKFILFNPKIVIHIHGMDLNLEKRSYIFKRVFKKIWNKSNVIIILSKKIIKEFHSLNKKDIYIINNYSEKMITRIALNKKISSFTSKPLKILYLSNLIYSKGVIDVIDAINILNTEYMNIELTLVGQILGDNFFSKKKLSDIIHQKLNKKIFLKGAMSGKKKWKLLEKSHILILPTFYKSEFQPISIIEGMSFGCLIISTDHGAILESFGKNNLLLVKKNNPQSIQKLIIKILNKPELFKKNIINAYRLVQNKFRMKTINENIYKILDH